MWRVLLLCVVFVSFSCKSLPAQDTVSGKPVLRIASPFAATLFQMDITADETFAVTSTAEGVAAVWDLRSPGKYDVLRAPFREAQRTRATGVAISPDGRYVALGVPPLAGEGSKVKLGTGRVVLFDRVNNKQLALKGDMAGGLTVPTAVPKLKFSPDGEYLFALLGTGCGIRIWETRTWTLYAADDKSFQPPDGVQRPYCGAEEQEADIEGLRYFNNFDMVFHAGTPASGKKIWFTVSGSLGVHNFKMIDGGIERVNFMPASGLQLLQPRGLALDKTKQRLAIGDNRQMHVAVVNAETLAPLERGFFKVPESYIDERMRSERDTHLSQVAWLEHGGKEWLIAAGYLSTARLSAEGRNQILDDNAKHRYKFGEFLNNLVRWDPEENAEAPKLLAFGNDTIMALRPFAKDSHLFVTALNSLGLITASGDPSKDTGDLFIGRKASLDFRKADIAASKDGKSLIIKNYSGSDQELMLEFSLSDLSLLITEYNEIKYDGFIQSGQFIKPSIDPELLGEDATLTKRFIDGLPRFFNKDFDPSNLLFNPKQLDMTDRSRALALSQDNQFVLWGSSNALRLVKNDGRYAKVICSEPIRYEALAVTFAQNDSLAIAAHSDGAIRWYRIKDRETDCRLELMLVLYAEDQHGAFTWTAFRPDGKFYSSNVSDGLAGWQSMDNFGQSKFDNLVQFIPDFFSSEIIKKTLDISEASNLNEGIVTAVNKQKSNYRIDLINSERTELRELTPFNVKLRIQYTQDADPLMSLNFFINGDSVRKKYLGIDYAEKENIIVRKPGDYEISLFLPASAREANGPFKLRIEYGSAIAELAPKKSLPPFENFEWQGRLLEQRPRRIFALLVGLSDYDDRQHLDLKFAHKDAIDFAKLLMNDFEKELSDGTQSRQAFSQLNIDLILSPINETATRILLKSIDDQVNRINKNNLGSVNYNLIFLDGNSSPLPAGGSRAPILNSVEKIRKNIVTDNENYKDVVFLYFSGHGVSHKFVKSEADNYLIMPETPAYKKNRGGFLASSLNINQVIKYFSNINAEKFVILDACRTNIEDIDATAHIYDSIGKTLPEARVFVSAELGQESISLSDIIFPRKYPSLYDDIKIPEEINGNSVFTHAFILSMHCKDTAIEKSGGNFIEPKSIGFFLYKYFQPNTVDMTNLLDFLNKSKIITPIVFTDDRHAPKRYWYRKLENNPPICIKIAGH